MTHYSFPPEPGVYGYADRQVGTSMNDVIRPCLRQAFPMPVLNQTGDERFQMMLDALKNIGAREDH